MNPNYDSYLHTATQLQRWRDFQAQVAAYLVINIVFVIDRGPPDRARDEE